MRRNIISSVVIIVLILAGALSDVAIGVTEVLGAGAAELAGDPLQLPHQALGARRRPTALPPAGFP